MGASPRMEGFHLPNFSYNTRFPNRIHLGTGSRVFCCSASGMAPVHTKGNLMRKNGRFIVLWLGLFLSVCFQAGAGTPPVSLQIEKLLEDKNHDGAADLIGTRVMVTGVLISRPRLINGDRPAPANTAGYMSAAHIQDETAGIRVVAADKLLVTEGYDIGDVLEISGTLENVLARPQLVSQSIRRLAESQMPVAVPVTAAELQLKQFSGRLVQITGNLVLPNQARSQGVVLQDRTGRVSLNISDQIFHNPEFVRSLAETKQAQVTGIVDWRNGSLSLRPRDVGDIAFRFSVSYRTVIAVSSPLCFLVVYFWMRRRAAETRARDVAKLMTDLKHSEEKYRDLVEKASDIIWETDTNSVFTYCSPNIRTILGYAPDDLIGKTRFDIMPGPEAERVRKLLAGHASENRAFSLLEHEVILPDGRIGILQCSGGPVLDSNGDIRGYRGIDRDITHRKELEKQLTQAQKMDAIGNLAGGIAHDFNNILTVISGYSCLLLENEFPTQVHQWATGIKNSSDRAARLTRQLLAFGRRQARQPQLLDLNVEIRKISEMLARVIPENIEFRSLLARQLHGVKADRSQIEQILMNLAVNARDAMPAGGTLTIETQDINIGPDEADVCGFGPGKYVRLAVRDTGVGMTPEVRTHIFEPFFTTKEISSGTGLGLATVYGIVEQSGGHVIVETAPGSGSAFMVYLPATDVTHFSEPEITAVEDKEIRTCTILLVEDQPDVRMLIAHTLRASGHAVLEAGSGPEALKLCADQTAPLDLLISDVVMPGMSGPEVAMRALRLRPELRIIYISGYVDARSQVEGAPAGEALLLKPFTNDVLRSTIQAVLKNRPAIAAATHGVNLHPVTVN